MRDGFVLKILDTGRASNALAMALAGASAKALPEALAKALAMVLPKALARHYWGH